MSLDSNTALYNLVKLDNATTRDSEAVYRAKCDLLASIRNELELEEKIGEKSEIEYQVRKMRYNGCMNEK